MKSRVRHNKDLMKRLLLFATIPLSLIGTLILFVFKMNNVYVVWTIIWVYTFLIVFFGWRAYCKLIESTQMEMKKLVNHENLINKSLLLINTEEKLKNVLSLEIERCAELKQQSALVFFDIDELGEINRKYGFDIGDGVIVDIIKATKDLIGPKDHLGRVKGDTFAVVFPKKDKEHAYEFAYKLSEEVRNIEKSLEVPVTCRFVTLTIDGWNTDDRVLSLAYEQLKIAKHMGRGVIL